MSDNEKRPDDLYKPHQFTEQELRDSEGTEPTLWPIEPYKHDPDAAFVEAAKIDEYRQTWRDKFADDERHLIKRDEIKTLPAHYLPGCDCAAGWLDSPNMMPRCISCGAMVKDAASKIWTPDVDG